MKKFTFFQICYVFLMVSTISFAQVGIGTTSPKGVLDIDSGTYGVVYPTVALTSTLLEAPVVNPLGGGLAIGTTVYNTNRTNTGANDVEPGIYSWDGTEWVIHFFKRQQRLYPQTSTLRTDEALGYQDIPGIGASDARNMTAKYSGRYRIEVKMTYGGGYMVTSSDIETTMAQGNFRFTFDGTPYILPAKSFSTWNNYISGGRQFADSWIQTTRVIYVNLIQDQNYTFSLEFDQAADTRLQASGSISGPLDGRGTVGSQIPCYIEISYMGE